MNRALVELAQRVALSDDSNERLRLAFALECVARVQHLLEDARAIDGLGVLQRYLSGSAGAAELAGAAAEVKDVANRHRGSNSIDGSAHAAVSATYAVANALQGRALDAAGYAAYAAVYAYGGYAVNDPSSFEPEYAWQVATLERLVEARRRGSPSDPHAPRSAHP